jgi:DNA-binding MarR family transcriptional regulator
VNLRTRRQEVNDLLVQTFNSILSIEQAALKDKDTEDITITEIHALGAMDTNAPLPMNVIARKCGVTVATLTTTVNRLVEKGYVERQRSETDRRQVLISLTARGQNARSAHVRFHERLADRALDGLSCEQEEILVDSLIRIRDFFESQS